MTPRKPKPEAQGVSDAELDVLKHLWRHGSSSPSELREGFVAAGVDWAYTTVQTLLHRLHDKGFVTRERQGVTQLYSAAVSREELFREQMSDLVERVGVDTTSPLVLNLVRGKRLTKRDIARLRAMLDEAEANRGKLPE